MSCRSTPAGSAWTTFARLESGLSDVQTLSAFHALRAEGEGVTAPTQTEWDQFVLAQRIEMEAAGFTDARIRSIGGRMGRAIEQLPDGRSWYALRNIRERSVTESNRVMGEIAQLAQTSGASVGDLTARYEERLRAVERGRSVETPDGYAEARTQWRTAGLPADHGTYTVLTQMRAEAAAARTEEAPPRRIEPVMFPNSRAIYSAGYDPTDGRLEVTFRRRNRDGETTGTSRMYSYHSIPASVWADMNSGNGDGAGLVYNREVRNHSEYRYESVEAEEAAASARCDECGQWRAAAHTCPDVEPAPEQAVQPDPVVVSTSRDGRRRLISSVPADLLTPNEPALDAAELRMLAHEDASRAADLADQAYAAATEDTDYDELNERCSSCGDPIDDGDGYDGECGDCADATYAEADGDDDAGDDYYSDGSKPLSAHSGGTAASTTSLLAGLATATAPVADAETPAEAQERDAAIADLRARLTGTSGQTAAQARIAEAIPDPLTAAELDIPVTSSGRFTHMTNREMSGMSYDEGRYDGIRLPAAYAMGDAWRQAAIQPVVWPVQWHGSRYTQPDGTRRYSHFTVRGEIVYSRLSGQETFSGRNLQCNCRDYQDNYDCTHVREAVAVHATAISAQTVGLGRGINADQPPLPEGARRGGVNTRFDSRYSRGRSPVNGAPSWGDMLHTPTRVTDARTAANTAPIILPVDWTGNRGENSSDGLPAGQFQVTGSMVYSRPNRGEHEFTGRDLRCTCPAYREEYRCPHVDAVADVYRERIMPVTGSRGSSRASGPMTETEIANAQRVAETALRADWTRQEATNAEARARHAAADPADSYTGNFEAFEADHEAALARKAAGEQVIPLMTSGAMGGQFTRESGRGFGVELEFDFPNGVNRGEALRAIGRDLHAAGLTRVAQQERYHASAARGYVDTHAGGWSYEQDCTVAGEIVSPIMYDEPETWENLAKISEIVKRHGGVANAKTGSHVHVGAPNMTTQTAAELMHTANSHEDLMYRLSQNPERPTHRPMRWCGPNQEVPQGGYTDHYEVRRVGSSHGFGMNLAGVAGRNSDHPEIRYWDGTMDAATIQAQVKISCAMVLAAERNASQPRATNVRESVGSHHTRLQAVRGRSRRALTSEELNEDTATFRSFMDTLFTRREDKAQITALFATTSWQKR